MKSRLLILPSWYITPKHRIGGSFFQAQANLIRDDYDTRVIFVQKRMRPSIKKTLRMPLANIDEWLDYLRGDHDPVLLPDDEVFSSPPLFLYQRRMFAAIGRKPHVAVLRAWMNCVNTMIASGWRPDLIRAHTAYPAGVVAKRIKAIHGIPYLISEHKPFSLFRFERELQSEIKESFKSADLVLSLSHDKVRQLAMSGIDVNPNIIFNFVDETVFKGLAPEYISGRPLQLVTIGAGSFYKDHKTLLRTVRILVDAGVPFHLTIIGLDVWGEQETRVETLAMIRQLDLVDRVSIIGRLSRSEIAEILPQFNVFVITSIQEGFPNSVLEALACGLFVVATRHGGTEDLLNDSMGRLTSIKDVAGLASILESIFRGEISFAPSIIREQVIRICGREAYRARLLGYYEQVCQKRCCEPRISCMS